MLAYRPFRPPRDQVAVFVLKADAAGRHQRTYAIGECVAHGPRRAPGFAEHCLHPDTSWCTATALQGPPWADVAYTAVRPARHRGADHLCSVRSVGAGRSRGRGEQRRRAGQPRNGFWRTVTELRSQWARCCVRPDRPGRSRSITPWAVRWTWRRSEATPCAEHPAAYLLPPSVTPATWYAGRTTPACFSGSSRYSDLSIRHGRAVDLGRRCRHRPGRRGGRQRRVHRARW